MAFPKHPVDDQVHHMGGVIYVYNAATNQWRIGPQPKPDFPYLEFSWATGGTGDEVTDPPPEPAPHNDQLVVMRTDGLTQEYFRSVEDLFWDGVDPKKKYLWTHSSVPATSGSPVGEIIMWPTATPPTGYLLCDGSAFGTTGPTGYPELHAVLGSDHTPDLRGQFIRGGATPDLTPKLWTTGKPKTALTMAGAGSHTPSGSARNTSRSRHRHKVTSHQIITGSSGSSASHYLTDQNRDGWGDIGAAYTYPNEGNHEHDLSMNQVADHVHSISGGGDAETAPDHVILAFVIRATP